MLIHFCGRSEACISLERLFILFMCLSKSLIDSEMFSLISEFLVLIITHNFYFYMCLSCCSKFRGFMIPTKTTKTGIQRIKIKFIVYGVFV